MSPDVVVRPGIASDADGVWPLARSFATSYEPQRDVFDASIAEVLRSPRALLLVADSSSQVGPVGYLVGHVHPALFANGPVAWIEELMVDPSHRRRGVATLLVATAEAWAAAYGASYIALATRRAEGFYRALGYDESAVFFRKTLSRD